MGTIAAGKSCAGYKPKTAICGNCDHERREPIEGTNRVNRTCAKNKWFVLMSGTCRDHVYKPRGNQHGTSQS
jgi:hypothetical protein